MRALKILGKCFSTIFPLLFRFFCVKRPDGAPSCLDGDSSCPDDMVYSSGCPFFLSGRVCFCDLLRGISSGRYLSSVRKVNPVGLNRILPSAARHFLLSFGSFCHLVHFVYTFYAYFSSARVSSLQFISTPGMFLYSFTNLF
jgi:hypothetical protein